MPKCPFCGKEINTVHVYREEMHKYEYFLDEKNSLRYNRLEVEQDDLHAICICPECEEELPFSLWRVGDFLREKLVILRSDDPEIKRKGDFVLYRGKVYKITDDYNGRVYKFTENGRWLNLLHLILVEDEVIADILGADLEGEG